MKEKDKKEKVNLEEIQKQLKECKQKCDEYLNNWKRERADFLNYKKGEIEKIGLLRKYAKEDIILKILPVLDNIYLAEEQLPKNLKNASAGSSQAIEWTKGFLQTRNLVSNFLKKEGIEEIKTIGEKFDPSLMEAIGEIEVKGKEPGLIIEEVQKGYKMHQKIIRPAKVKITK